MRIFLTGSEGFIGSHLTEHLLNKGHEVVALVQYNSFSRIGWLEENSTYVNPKLKIVFGDVRDFSQMKTYMSGCDAVIHLAALIAIPYSYHAPSSYLETNINGTYNILQASRELKINRILHTSTSEVYGTAVEIPITEKHPIQTQSPYSASKSAADMLAYSYFCSFELPVVTMRPFNVFGPRQSTRAVIPSLITQIASGVEQIKVGNIDATREFNFVTDTVNAFELALTAPDIEGKTLNIGNSHEVSIRTVIDLLSEMTPAGFEIVEDSTRLRPEKSEVQRLVSDSSIAKRALDWSPVHAGESGFKKGLLKTFEWFSNPTNLSKYDGSSYSI